MENNKNINRYRFKLLLKLYCLPKEIFYKDRTKCKSTLKLLGKKYCHGLSITNYKLVIHFILYAY